MVRSNDNFPSPSEGEHNRPSSGGEAGGHYPSADETSSVSGILETLPEGYGVLRTLRLLPSPKDVYVSASQIHRFDLRVGDLVEGLARPPKEGERYLSLLRVEKVENFTVGEVPRRPYFEDLTPIFPNEWLNTETTPDILSTRLVDLICPIGKGQRGTIVAPPYAGKTWLLKELANGITANHKDVSLIVALIAERPEEVTDIERSVKGQVVAANFDEPPEVHTRVAELALERAKRLTELGNNVVMLLDSITRLARAYNLCIPPSGRTLSGGFDPVALYPPKHFFGAARNFEKGGSLTIIATALVETGSRMDDLIYEEFKGTGNMELFLDRRLAQRRAFPAIDIKRSYTRHEELLYDSKTAEKVHRLRRMVDLLSDDEATPRILERLRKTKSNKEFLETLHERK